jgi:BirA family biotin operon repressor/biotin-[acetyl-CoA-carboxylase] ligase
MSASLLLVRRLADGRFCSGQSLADELGISRAGVWKRLNRLGQQLQLEIQAVPGRGYRLAEPLELLDSGQILGGLETEAAGSLTELHLHQQVDSTNSWLMQKAAAGAASGSVCLAEQQIAGRGRRGRTWVSPFGANIYLSLLWRFNQGPAQLSGLSLAAGLAVLRALHRQGVQGPGLKWPNDLLWNGRKLAGLLLELAGETGGPSYVVLGVGLNLRLSAAQAGAIDQPWVDVRGLPGSPAPSRNQLAGALISELLVMLRAFERSGFAPLAAEWNRHDLYRGYEVVLTSGQGELRGVHRGVNPAGALLLEQAAGVHAHHAGELSLRLP